MSKQDKTYSRTPEDIERKYNLGRMSKGGSGADNERISQIIKELSEYKTKINSLIEELNALAETNKNTIENHVNDVNIHVSQEEKGNWNNSYDKAYKDSKTYTDKKITELVDSGGFKLIYEEESEQLTLLSSLGSTSA